MNTMKMHSINMVDKNIEKIAQIFPHCITEGVDENGEFFQGINFELLKQELSRVIVDDSCEKYCLQWPGKYESLIASNASIAKSLRPVHNKSKDFDTTKNIFIEGDNLDALKLLQESYLGKIKMVYIDPPYNTGNDFIYDDDFSENSEGYLIRTNQTDDEGNRLIANTEANGRFHSDWLSMMYSRLRLARNLLTEDGGIFISIDDCEVANLRKIADEIFGSDCFMGELVWKSRQIVDSRNFNNISKDHEYILIYAKNSNNFSMKGKSISEDKYKNPDNDPRGPWMSNSMLGLANASQRPNLHYEIVDPKTGNRYPCPPESGWRYSPDTMKGKIEEGRVIFPASPTGRPREKKYINELASNFTGFSSILPVEVGFTLNGSREVRELLGEKYFDFPKPVSLLQALVEQGTTDDDIVLDFFAGSGTTGHAVYKANYEDGGNRKFILVQIPEKIDEKSNAFKNGFKAISDLSATRLIKAAELFNQGLEAEGRDLGFRFFKIDSSNMSDVYYNPDAVSQDLLSDQADNVKADRSPEDLLFQVLLDWGVDLSLPIKKETIQGKTVYLVDQNALAACFDSNGGIDEDFVKELAKKQPLRVVFRDAGFKSDSVKINVEQIFKLVSPSTEVKCI